LEEENISPLVRREAGETWLGFRKPYTLMCTGTQ